MAQLQDQVTALSQRADTASVGVATSSPGRHDSGVMAGGVDESVGTSDPPLAQVHMVQSLVVVTSRERYMY